MSSRQLSGRWFSLRPGIIWVLFGKAFHKRPRYRSDPFSPPLAHPPRPNPPSNSHSGACESADASKSTMYIVGMFGCVHFWQIWKLLCKMNNLVESVKLIWPSPLTQQTFRLCSGGDDGNDGSVSAFPRSYNAKSLRSWCRHIDGSSIKMKYTCHLSAVLGIDEKRW